MCSFGQRRACYTFANWTGGTAMWSVPPPATRSFPGWDDEALVANFFAEKIQDTDHHEQFACRGWIRPVAGARWECGCNVTVCAAVYPRCYARRTRHCTVTSSAPRLVTRSTATSNENAGGQLRADPRSTITTTNVFGIGAGSAPAAAGRVGVAPLVTVSSTTEPLLATLPAGRRAVRQRGQYVGLLHVSRQRT